MNLYAIAAVLLAAASIQFDLLPGPMRAAEERARRGEVLRSGAAPMVDPAVMASADEEGDPARAGFMVWPIVLLVLGVPMGLWLTGDGDMTAGSGSTSVLWAVCAGLTLAWVLALRAGERMDSLMQISLRGAGALLPVAIILLLALALGDATRALGTGPFLAQVISDAFPTFALPALVFVVAAFTAFSIGSSWGTFAITIPIAIPMALELGLSPSVFLAAALSGGVFGDHASPISDTTVVASMAAATDHIDHVRTQLPYALLAGGVAVLGFLILGPLRAPDQDRTRPRNAVLEPTGNVDRIRCRGDRSTIMSHGSHFADPSSRPNRGRFNERSARRPESG